MCDKESGSDMEATIKRIDKTNISGLSKNKKELLKKHMGSASTKLDLNKVREWWKNETSGL